MSSFAKATDILAEVLESESNCAIEWFDENKMIVNPDKFQAILLDKCKLDLTDKNIKIGNQNMQVISGIKMLEVHIDHKLNFKFTHGQDLPIYI